MSVTTKKILVVSKELYMHVELLGYSKNKIMSDLKFTNEQFYNTLEVNKYSKPVDVRILKDYLDEKLLLECKTPKPSVILKENINFPYKKYW